MKLPRTLSMRLKSEFLRVRTEGESFGGRHLVLAVLANQEVPEFKVGFVVPKRVGNAVSRNRVKRRLRNIFSTTAERLKPNRYVVTVARRGSAEQPYAALRKEWRWLAGRAGLFNDSEPSRCNSSSQATDPKQHG
jgi:ribonuclease P protein component